MNPIKKTIVILIIILLGGSLAAQSDRLPENGRVYRSCVSAFLTNPMFNRNNDPVRYLFLMNNGEYEFREKGMPRYREISPASVFYHKRTMDVGRYKIIHDSLFLCSNDSTVGYRYRFNLLSRTSDSLNKEYYTYELPFRFGIGLSGSSYDPSANMTTDLFPFRNKHIYISASGGLSLFSFNVGAGVGVQYKHWLCQLDYHYVFYLFPQLLDVSENAQAVQPKIGFVYGGWYVKAGPSFLLTGKSLINHWPMKVFNTPVRIEAGYYLPLSTNI